jgi:hypothetical protein
MFLESDLKLQYFLYRSPKFSKKPVFCLYYTPNYHKKNDKNQFSKKLLNTHEFIFFLFQGYFCREIFSKPKWYLKTDRIINKTLLHKELSIIRFYCRVIQCMILYINDTCSVFCGAPSFKCEKKAFLTSVS